MRVLIVGAGMSGLTAGRTLAAEGYAVSVVDKGRAVGGRMGSKRIGDARFDHGAQHFSARSPEFRELVGGLVEAGVAKVWFDGQSVTDPVRGVEPRHVGSPAMRSIPEHLANGLDVRLGHQVGRIHVDAWEEEVVTDTGLRSDVAVLTAPIPQTLAMLDVFGGPAPELADIRYDPCLAAMLTFDRQVELPDGHLAFDSGPIAWIADNQHKGVSSAPAVTVHSSPAFARRHLEEGPAEWLPLIVAEVEARLPGRVVDAHGHRWRYSMPTNPLDVGAIEVQPGVVVAGEALAGARIEGAFLSGLAAARMVREWHVR